MNEKTFTCMVGDCGKTFASQAAKNSHRKMKHGKKVRQADPYRRNARPMASLDPDFIYSMVEAMDLPDGAHWAMIEELSGLEPGDFA